MHHILRKSQVVLHWTSGPPSEAISSGMLYVMKTQHILLTNSLAPLEDPSMTGQLE